MLPAIITAISLFNAVFLFISLPFDTTTINEKGKKVITKSGIRSIIGLFIFVSLPLIQYFFQENETTKSEKRIVLNLTSIYQNSVKEIQNNSKRNYDSTVAMLSTNLGIYKLALDSAKKRIVEMMDSIPKANPSQIPILKILDISDGSVFKLKSKDSTGYKYAIPFYSADASSCCFNIKGYVVGHKSGSGYVLKKVLNNALLFNYDIILKNTSLVSDINFGHVEQFDTIYLAIIGKYKDYNTKITYSINDVYFNDQNTNTSGWVTGGEIKKSVMGIVKNH